MTDETKNCGRIDKHLAHYWVGTKVWHSVWLGGKGRWVKPTFWCTGRMTTEGAQRWPTMK